jgi:hypothetical protein
MISISIVVHLSCFFRLLLSRYHFWQYNIFFPRIFPDFSLFPIYFSCVENRFWEYLKKEKSSWGGAHLPVAVLPDVAPWLSGLGGVVLQLFALYKNPRATVTGPSRHPPLLTGKTTSHRRVVPVGHYRAHHRAQSSATTSCQHSAHDAIVDLVYGEPPTPLLSGVTASAHPPFFLMSRTRRSPTSRSLHRYGEPSRCLPPTWAPMRASPHFPCAVVV